MEMANGMSDKSLYGPVGVYNGIDSNVPSSDIFASPKNFNGDNGICEENEIGFRS